MSLFPRLLFIVNDRVRLVRAGMNQVHRFLSWERSMCSRLHIEREQFILKKSSQKDMAVGLKRKSPCCSCSGLASACYLPAALVPFG